MKEQARTVRAGEAQLGVPQMISLVTQPVWLGGNKDLRVMQELSRSLVRAAGWPFRLAPVHAALLI
jgi:hypothetical protein